MVDLRQDADGRSVLERDGEQVLPDYAQRQRRASLETMADVSGS